MIYAGLVPELSRLISPWRTVIFSRIAYELRAVKKWESFEKLNLFAQNLIIYEYKFHILPQISIYFYLWLIL